MSSDRDTRTCNEGSISISEKQKANHCLVHVSGLSHSILIIKKGYSHIDETTELNFLNVKGGTGVSYEPFLFTHTEGGKVFCLFIYHDLSWASIASMSTSSLSLALLALLAGIGSLTAEGAFDSYKKKQL